jgi:hypothetical protein
MLFDVPACRSASHLDGRQAQDVCTSYKDVVRRACLP